MVKNYFLQVLAGAFPFSLPASLYTAKEHQRSYQTLITDLRI